MSKALFLCDTNAPLARLEVKEHFDSLSDKEKNYGDRQKLLAHFIGRAAWAGARITSATTSHVSPLLFQLILDIFSDKHDSKKIRDVAAFKADAGLSEENWKLFLEYSVQVLYNLSNFKSFGDTKFVPNISEADFKKAVIASGSDSAIVVYEKLKDHIFALEPADSVNSYCDFAQMLHIGFPADGHTTGYYTEEVSKQEVEAVQSILEANNISPLNTRLFKTASNNYTLKIASANSTPSSVFKSTDGFIAVTVEYSDFQPQMFKAAVAMRFAAEFAANDTQRDMILKYAENFESGDMEAHKESQRLWIKDVGPVVESNIGFVETYRDPAGVRAEWEGFVAVVNKEQTAKFGKLVDGAKEFIKRLPWGEAFEKDVFNKPDFTSLEVLTFATSGGPPAGINIPNYDDIRMTLGFKNVSLANITNAKTPGVKVTFVSAEDLPTFEKWRPTAFEVQVGLHELLGHGSGKLLTEESEGKFNFDTKNPPANPITGEPVKTWYKPGQTWGSQFGAIASTYEECRAECVGMALCVDREILSIFHITSDEDVSDAIFTNYTIMARAGLASLEVYDPKNARWGQAHMQARYGILRTLMNAGLVHIEETDDENLFVHVDRSKILTHGVPAVKELLVKLQTYKATADSENGIAFYKALTSVPEQWIKYRDIVIKRKLPRMILVQGNTFLDEKSEVATFKEYPLTLEGFIESVIERNF
ncbi:hypothetical protein HK100_006834 [Physocladia obscura]|uniref:Dipeptidyl peptidase 3 n=1 Tax=Physocladia obscura TaxID=109957 RepID=A0AAD5SSM5_9FUNG|nr:hypothetical protein HK100_006834 [Physocladia obscura]